VGSAHSQSSSGSPLPRPAVLASPLPRPAVLHASPRLEGSQTSRGSSAASGLPHAEPRLQTQADLQISAGKRRKPSSKDPEQHVSHANNFSPVVARIFFIGLVLSCGIGCVSFLFLLFFKNDAEFADIYEEL